MIHCDLQIRKHTLNRVDEQATHTAPGDRGERAGMHGTWIPGHQRGNTRSPPGCGRPRRRRQRRSAGELLGLRLPALASHSPQVAWAPFSRCTLASVQTLAPVFFLPPQFQHFSLFPSSGFGVAAFFFFPFFFFLCLQAPRWWRWWPRLWRRC